MRKITRLQKTIVMRQIENMRWNLYMFVFQNLMIGLVGYFSLNEDKITIRSFMQWLLLVALKIVHSIMTSLLQNLKSTQIDPHLKSLSMLKSVEILSNFLIWLLFPRDLITIQMLILVQLINFFPLSIAYGILTIAYMMMKAQKFDQSNRLRQSIINKLFDQTTLVFKISDES